MATNRLLLTNDDGWDAPGLAALKGLSSRFGESLVLAPSDAYSYCGHRVTTDEKMELVGTGPGSFRLSGTPADCVRAGLRLVFAGSRIEWVISGINRGGNLGADIYTSGTVAAAREAALLGVPAIAVSQYIRRGVELDWARSAELAALVLAQLMAEGCPSKTFWNVNLPHLTDGRHPEVVRCEPDDTPLDVRFVREGDSLKYSGSYQERDRTPGRDIDLCFGGAITVSQLRL